MDKHYPYQAAIMNIWETDTRPLWWPTSSHPDDEMVIGDGIPGDEASATLCARCCNIAYQQALDDVIAAFALNGVDATKLVQRLLKPDAKVTGAPALGD